MSDRVVEQLQTFGLPKNEVKAYFLLAAIGTCTVGVIARRLATNRMSVYRTIKSLEEKGLVEAILERPTKYVARPITDFLDRYIEDYKTKTLSLEKNKTDIVEHTARLQATAPEAEDPKFRIVQGRTRIFDQILKMLAGAKSEVCIVQTGNGLFHFTYEGIDDELKKLRDAGVEVVVLTHIDESCADAAKTFARFARVQHAALPSKMRLVLVDDVEALTTFSMDDSLNMTTDKDLAMWIKSPDYVRDLKMFFEALLKEAIPAESRLLAIETKKKLAKTLDAVRKILDADGWTTMVPGKLTGESGIDHAFDLIARHGSKDRISIVIDLLCELGPSQILTFGMKALDVDPTLRFILAPKAPGADASELASRHDVKIVFAKKSSEATARIIGEARRILG